MIWETLLMALRVPLEDLDRDARHRPPRLLDVDLARGGDVLDPVAADGIAKGAGQRAPHRGDRV